MSLLRYFKILTSAKGATLEGQPTSTDVDADTQALDVAIKNVKTRDINTQVVSGDIGLVTNSVIHGKTTAGGGTYVDVKVNPSGALTVEATISADEVGLSTLAEQQTQTTLLEEIVPNLDAFGRLRISQPVTIFDAQFTYDLQPLLYEQTVNTGATITHDSTNRCALLNVTSSSANSNATLQSYEHIRYQPSKSQLVYITFAMATQVAGLRQTVGLGTLTNGFEFTADENGLKRFRIASASSNGNETAFQSAWNVDKLDGTGASGLTLNVTKTNILILDFQALYVGRVRMGFVIDGSIIWAHEFLHSNVTTNPYLQTANLPIIAQCRTVATTGITASMKFICCAVVSEGGQELTGYDFSQSSGSVSIGSGVDTHILSIQPSLLFNSITNRAKFIDFEFEINITGNNPMDFKLVIGQTLSGTTAFNSVNATYSAMDYNILGTLSGSPLIIIDQGSVFANATIKESTTKKVQFRYPITLDSAGAARTLGRLTLIGSGVGGTTTAKGVLKWREIR